MATEPHAPAKTVPVHENEKIALDDISDADDRELARLGKKSVLRRNFRFLSILGFACAIMITWEGMLCVFAIGLTNGGPGGLIYQFLFCWAGYAAVVATMGELVSMQPTAGGQYVWCIGLSPKGMENFLSYITGWQSVIAWQATAASGAFLSATILQGIVVLNYPDYDFKRWHGTLLMFAVMGLALILNTLLAKWLPHIENTILFLHITVYVVVLVCITVLAPAKSSPHDVFALFLNGGNYASMGLSWFVGLTGSVFMFIGADGAVHMVEEMKGARTALPWALIGSIVINGVLGFTMLIAILFCIGDVDADLTSPTGYPFIAIFTYATRSIAGGTGLSVLVLSFAMFSTIGAVTAASRQLWAFGRDNGVPFARFASYVDPRVKLPTAAIGVTVTVTCLLSLINIGSSTAFNAMVSLVVAGFLASYIVPFSLLVWRRLTDPSLVMGPWNMGRAGVFVNAFGLVWAVISFFFSFWPGAVHPTASTMNYSILLYGATVLFSIVFWIAHGRKTYKGLVIETTVVEHLT